MKVLYLGSLARDLVIDALTDSPFDVATAENDADVARHIVDAAVLVTTGPWYTQSVAELAGTARNLRLIQLTSAGFDSVEKFGAPAGAQVCNAADAWSIAVSEHAMALMLATSRRLVDAIAQQRNHVWQRDYANQCRSLYGKTLVIVGYGRIGKQIARRARAFAMRVVAVNAVLDKDDYVDDIVAIDALSAVLPQADVVVAAVPSTLQTVNMFDATTFAHCKRGAIFINVARGDVVNAADLYAVLTNGQLGAAAIDVAVPEPLPADSPLWTAPNLLITPHVAGAVPDLVPLNIRDVVVENLHRLARGQPLQNRVLLNTG